MADENARLNDSIDRALEAARLADDAAQEFETLTAAQTAFVTRVEASSKRLGIIALGALVGSALTLGVAGLIYSRSVQNLYEASSLQAEATALLLDQTIALEQIVKDANTFRTNTQQQIDLIDQSLLALKETVIQEISAFAAESASVQPQFATSVTESVSGLIAETEDRLSTAIMEHELAIIEQIATLSVDEAAGLSVAATLAEIKTMLEANRTRTTSRSTQSSSRSTTRSSEPNPFSLN